MLFTAQYIRMFQENWKPKIGDYCICSKGMIGVLTSGKEQVVTYPDGNTGYAYVGIRLKDGAPWSSRKPTWLPTQEQLQEMLYPPLDILLMEFWQWVRIYEVGVKYASMNELWLAFVMHTKYRKFWNDREERWIKRIQRCPQREWES